MCSELALSFSVSVSSPTLIILNFPILVLVLNLYFEAANLAQLAMIMSKSAFQIKGFLKIFNDVKLTAS